LLFLVAPRDSTVTEIDLNPLNASLNQVKRAVFVLLALGMVLFARADEKPPRLSVGALPAAQTLSVKDVKESEGWFLGQINKALSRGYIFIGRCYEKGKVVAKNENEAFKWYTKSAEQGNAEGQNNLGVCYQNGKGVAKDEKEAVSWYTKAAEQRNGNAQINLGWCYENGLGVLKDEKEALCGYT
jgi:TPR repeat protein